MKVIKIFLFTLLLLFFLPIIITQVINTLNREGRKYEWVSLEDTKYQEISFHNKIQDINLGGMLFIPEGEGPFPAAVIIHGSGSSLRANGWYLTLTKYLQDNGIVVLLPDKRGSESSEGDWRTASFEDLATDTLAAIDFLMNQNLVELSHIGLIGLSQGGRIAPIVASGSEDIAYLVNVVGGALPAFDSLRYEEVYNLQEMGILPGFSNVLAFGTTRILTDITKRDFWDAVGNFDPLPYWNELSINALVLYGENDTNVPSEESAQILRSLHKPNIEVIIFEGSGHALEDPEGKGNSIFREDAMNQIRDFIYLADSQ